ncbi:MAG: META domain-containing protein, partial [Candidatus Electrothrix sp. AR3]|nr:META domain-containing protein [Candidatus Electrothrix sp. AR3]
MRIFSHISLLCCLLLAGCAVQQKSVTLPPAKGLFSLSVPTVYTANLPREKCPPISFALILRPDGLYFLRVNRVGSGLWNIRSEAGAWKYNATNKTIQLNNYDNDIRILSVTPQRTLKVLRSLGGIMPPYLNYEFVPTNISPVYEDVVRMQGMYSCSPNGEIFRECLSGKTFPVARGWESGKMEQACLDTLHGQKKSVFVALNARLESGQKKREELVPVRFIDIYPVFTCSETKSDILTIEDNRWHLLEVDGKMLEENQAKKMVFLEVKREENWFRGFSGCNSFAGTWRVRGKEFFFSRTDAVRTACLEGIEVEDALLHALDNTWRYQIKNNVLHLSDRHGKVLAKLRHNRSLVGPNWEHMFFPHDNGEDESEIELTQQSDNLHLFSEQDNGISQEVDWDRLQDENGTLVFYNDKGETVYIPEYYRKEGTYVSP